MDECVLFFPRHSRGRAALSSDLNVSILYCTLYESSPESRPNPDVILFHRDMDTIDPGGHDTGHPIIPPGTRVRHMKPRGGPDAVTVSGRPHAPRIGAGGARLTAPVLRKKETALCRSSIPSPTAEAHGGIKPPPSSPIGRGTATIGPRVR